MMTVKVSKRSDLIRNAEEIIKTDFENKLRDGLADHKSWLDSY